VSPFLGTLIGAGVLATIIIVIGFILIIVPGLIALTFLAVVAPAVVIDRAGVTGALRRSRELVSGHAWRVFGVIVVLFLITAVIGGILSAIGGSASDESFAGYAVADLIVRVLLGPLTAIAATVIYVELRRVKGEPLAQDSAPTQALGEDPPVPPPAAPEAPAGPEAPTA
jgi:hypothetical protein